MAETSKNKIYYNDNENSIADVLTDMKKMAESTDEAIEKSKYDDTEIKNKDTEQDSKIEELQNQKTELEKELKEMQEDYYQTSIRGQASEEYIHVEDSSGARCKIGISGNSEQETRSGKNLLELMEGTYSNNGITAVVKDGVITLNGTATAISFVGINLLKSIELTNDKAYHLSAFNERTVGDGTNYCSLRLNQDNIQVLFNTANVNGSITTNLKISYITIRTQTGITYNNFVVKPQLEIGNGTDTWEQGGVSPSLDYPSQVKAVGDNVNLFDITRYDYRNLAGADVQINDKTNFRISATSNGNANCAVGFKVMDLTKYAGKTLTIKAYVKSNTSTNKAFFVLRQNNADYTGTKSNELYDESQNTTDGVITLKYKITDTINDSNRYLFIGFYATRGVACKIGDYVDYKVKLVEGTEVGEYSKYGQGSVKLTKCNKNLSKYKTFTSTSSARVVGDTTTSGQQIEGIKVRKGKKYTISFDVVSLPSSDYRIQIRESTDESVAQTNGEIPNSIQNEPLICNTLTRHSKTITTQGDNYLYIRCIPNGFVLDNIQVEEKETSTHYEQHEEQSYIMPVQKEMLQEDYFDFDNEEEVHTCDKLVLNGTEDIKIWIVMDDYYGIYISATEAQDISAWSKTTLLSNTFKTVQGSVMNNKTYQDNCVATWGKNIFIRIEKSIIGGNDDNTNDELLIKFKSYLKSLYDAGTPVMIYYKLQTPTRIAFTAEQKAVAKELNNARTYKNVTNITTDSKAILSLDYVKDQETQNQKMQNEIDEIKQLLSTTQTSAMLLDNLQKEVESEVE